MMRLCPKHWSTASVAFKLETFNLELRCYRTVPLCHAVSFQCIQKIMLPPKCIYRSDILLVLCFLGGGGKPYNQVIVSKVYKKFYLKSICCHIKIHLTGHWHGIVSFALDLSILYDVIYILSDAFFFYLLFSLSQLMFF